MTEKESDVSHLAMIVGIPEASMIDDSKHYQRKEKYCFSNQQTNDDLLNEFENSSEQNEKEIE